MPLNAGDKLGHYEITGLIGKGGMGEVYKAHDPRVGRDVAIKVSGQQFTERFDREARAIAALNHPNICTLYDVGPNYLVMEFVDGEPPKGPLPLKDALRVMRQVADGLEAAHEKGITHRDLKPGNILLKSDGWVKVLDFGLAKVAPAAGESTETITLGATLPGAVVGTPAYMAPEQARGLPADKRADIWAFGLVLHELLTGKRTFTGDTMTDVLAAVVTREPDLSQVPDRVRPLLRRCLEKDPRKRLRDIGDAMGMVEDAVQAAPAGAPKRSLGWAVAAVIAVAAVAGMVWQSSRPVETPGWTGVRLGGPTPALDARISPNGEFLAFQAMVDGDTQVAVMKPESGNWTVLTHERSRGSVNEISWSRDGTRIYFDRFQDVPRGIYSVPVLGGEERLVLEDAIHPQALPDGSLVVTRLNAERQLQLHRYWPESGKLQPLKALVAMPFFTNSRVSPTGDRAVFWGTPLDQPDSPRDLYAINLGSEEIVRLASGASFLNQPAFAITADGKSVIFVLGQDDVRRVASASIDGSGATRLLFTATTDNFQTLDVGSDGSVYFNDWDREGHVLRLSPSGGALERPNSPELVWAPSGILGVPLALPLPDGRIVTDSWSAGRNQLLLSGGGENPAPFVDTQEQTSSPMSLAGNNQVAFITGAGADRTIALASAKGGRLIRRLEGSRGPLITSIASSADGETIYYSAAGSIWSIPASDGSPRKLRAGDYVAVDPYRGDMIVSLRAKDAFRLMRIPLAGGPERAIPVEAGVRIADNPPHPNEAGKDGRVLVSVLTNSWFLHVGVLDPDTGRVQIVKAGYDADLFNPGWTPDGKIMVSAFALRARLWRFRPESTDKR